MSTPIYCGNNANHSELRNGTKTLGTRLQCLKKGIQNGKSLPVDPEFKKPYRPIIREKKYCGNLEDLPDGYHRFGGLHECYLSGVGVGKRMKAKSKRKSKKSKRKSRRKSKKSRNRR